jgi:diguanylate cyclase (GGDEF)-like protein
MNLAATAEPFWNRVRLALGALRPMRQERVPGYGQAAIARSIGIKPKLGQLLEDELAAGWASAAGRHVSLSLLVIEIDRSAEYFAAYGKESTDDCVHAVMQAITACLPRPGDACLRLGRAGFVAVLPDLPALMARQAAARMTEAVRDQLLAHKESHAGLVTISLGLAVVNPRGTYDKKFFEAGAEALKKAQRKGISRLEVVDLRPAQQRKRKAA